MLLNDLNSLATLSLSTADVQLLLRANTMGITGRLGSLALSDDRSKELARPQFKQILSIEGKNFAEFRYQTLDTAETSTLGFNSTFSLNVGSLKVHFLEQPLHDIYLFVTKLAKLKVLYDAARDAAVQRASEIERMRFDVSVKTPIIVFPSDPSRLQDVLVMRLGEISAHNSHEADASKITASLCGIQLVSDIFYDGASSTLKMVDDIDIIADVIQTSGIDRSQENELPDTQVMRFFIIVIAFITRKHQIAVKISDVKLYLTQTQYILLMKLVQSIPKVLVASPEGNAQALELASPVSSSDSSGATSPHVVDLEPELHVADGIRAWTTVDLVASVKMVKLHLYDSLATREENLEDHGIMHFALNDSSLRYKSISDGAAEAQVVLKSFTVSNTRPGGSKFREIIPAADHDRTQFMVLYTMSGSSSVALLTVDSPHVILAIEPVITLLEFFMSAFQQDAPVDVDHASMVESQRESPQSRLDFRLELHDVSVSVLENDEDENSQALRLYIDQILLSQQVRPFFFVSPRC